MRTCETLEKSVLEKARRAKRWEILVVAQQIWDGQNPDQDTFRIYRDRFAPSIRYMLFPEVDLQDFPTKLPYAPNTGFLFDPTRQLRSAEQFDCAGKDWACEMAMSMLTALTSWSSPTYNLKGYNPRFSMSYIYTRKANTLNSHGGSVGTWKAAATKWHLRFVNHSYQSCPSDIFY
jgi:hypothetical protein